MLVHGKRDKTYSRVIIYILKSKIRLLFDKKM